MRRRLSDGKGGRRRCSKDLRKVEEMINANINEEMINNSYILA